MSLKFRNTLGLLTEVNEVCGGRRHRGVPDGGPMDQISFALVLDMVLRHSHESLYELFGGTEAEVLAPSVAGVVGPDCKIRINNREVPINASYHLEQGDILTIPANRPWGPVYVGFNHVRSGGLFPFQQEVLVPFTCSIQETLPSQVSSPIRVLPGPDGYLSEGLFTEEFQVDHRSNRSGIRLRGSLPEVARLPHSIPIDVGAIQLPPGGSPIIIGPDGPTIGGYPIIGVVPFPDVTRIGYLAPGSAVRFNRTSIEEISQEAEVEVRRVRSISNRILCEASGFPEPPATQS